METRSVNRQKIYCLCGVPGAGKTWITNHKDIQEKFHHIWHDGFIYLKQPGAYVRAILEQAEAAKKPILIDAPFSVRDTTDPLEEAGYLVEPIYILEDPDILAQRYQNDPTRCGKPLPKGHLTRMATYAERAKSGNRFGGNSTQVLEYLRSLV